MDYQRVLFAQCTPYLQWLKDRSAVDHSMVKDTGEPLCVFPFSSCTDRVKKVLGGRADRKKNYLFVNADGVLRKGACRQIAGVFAGQKNALLVYADEDYYGTLAELYQTEESAFEEEILSEYKAPATGLFRGEPWFKPDFSPDTLESFFYIGNMFALRGQVIGELMDTLGEELSLCDLVRAVSYKALSCHTHGANVFVHIPEVLYTNNRLSQKDVLDGREQDAFEESGVKRIGGRRANFGRLSVIIPSKDNPQVLMRCVETFEQCVKDIDYELVVVDNGSSDENRMCISSFLEKHGANYLFQNAEFNFSHMCNIGAEAAEGEFLLFLNDDIEVGETQQDGQWLTKMMRYAAMEHVGAVGIKLHYPDSDLIQHAGITNMAIGPAHKLGGMPDKGNLYHGHNLVDYNMLAVTAACMMISREKFERACGFDEELAVAYNDVELCFRLYRMGLYNVQVNSAFLIHHESLSRGQDTAPEKQARLLREKQKLYEKHPWASPKAQTPDPFYSPNLVQWEKDAAYHVNYQYPYDRPVRLKLLTGKMQKWFSALVRREQTLRNHAFAAKLYHKLTGANLHMYSLDGITQENGMVAVTGWHVWRKQDNAKLLKTFCIYNANGIYGAQPEPKLRRDVEALFADEADCTKNTALSGIYLKFDTAQLPGGRYSTGVVVEYRGRRQFVCMEESFEVSKKQDRKVRGEHHDGKRERTDGLQTGL